MNKNLKRALNTTAAVSMSLAMVLGAVSPVNIAAQDTAVLTGVDAALANKSKIEKVLNMLGDVTEIRLNDDLGKLPATNSDTKEELFTFDELLTAYADLFEEAKKYASVVGYTEEQTDALKHLVDVKTNVANLLGAADELEGYVKNNKKITDVYSGRETYLDLYEDVAGWMAFKGNVSSNDLETLEKIEENFADLEADAKDHKEDYLTVYAEAFAKKLADDEIAGIKVGKLVYDEGTIDYSKVTAVENFIKKVTKDSYSLKVMIDEKEVTVKYGDVKEEDEVVEIVEGLEAIVSEMKDVKELLADTKDEKKAFERVDLSELANIAKNGLKDESDYVALDEAIAKIRAKDVEAVKAYVDAVVNEFWAVAVDQRTSGSYRVKQVDAGLGRYYAFDKVAGADLHTLMNTLVDRDEEETFYDLLVADAASIDELLKAVTTDIEGMTMNTVMTNQQAAKIIAAKKALNKIDAGRDDKDPNTKSIYEQLSRSEKADVDANRELIEVLYFKLIINGEVTTIGWVETAKGWEYYDNNGKRVYEGWAPGNGYWSFMKNGYSVSNEWCAAKEGWYYMGADGKMVTGKVMINGVEEDFGTDGIWVRK